MSMHAHLLTHDDNIDIHLTPTYTFTYNVPRVSPYPYTVPLVDPRATTLVVHDPPSTRRTVYIDTQ